MPIWANRYHHVRQSKRNLAINCRFIQVSQDIFLSIVHVSYYWLIFFPTLRYFLQIPQFIYRTAIMLLLRSYFISSFHLSFFFFFIVNFTLVLFFIKTLLPFEIFDLIMFTQFTKNKSLWKSTFVLRSKYRFQSLFPMIILWWNHIGMAWCYRRNFVLYWGWCNLGSRKFARVQFVSFEHYTENSRERERKKTPRAILYKRSCKRYSATFELKRI